MEVYNNLTKVDEFLPLSKRERYMFTFRGENPSLGKFLVATASILKEGLLAPQASR